jgi:hypothetical protein
MSEVCASSLTIICINDNYNFPLTVCTLKDRHPRSIPQGHSQKTIYPSSYGLLNQMGWSGSSTKNNHQQSTLFPLKKTFYVTSTTNK